MNFQLESLLRNKPVIEYVGVLSFEMSVYLVQISVDGQRGLVYANDSKPKKFSSLGQIRDLFTDFKVGQAELVHQSAYGEMIGSDEESDNTMRLPIRLGADCSL
ncbi:DUF6482 family protein [Lacimicrobium alkaliphilum]|uniref:Na(+)-translocating NADH-quinone reductase subunit B n=1 Tax=Lacimicrobium alkaliphilum TaxID=1526571 RepID=A0A0U2PKP1_9ALTE|nr:DUF6482 family protein [Lacimicrobium alkaliphilum]ALT00190.1 hypothetical protein AT746_19245 [Lacimicrobium alkaliphilum]